jgi:hypothetical protein
MEFARCILQFAVLGKRDPKVVMRIGIVGLEPNPFGECR